VHLERPAAGDAFSDAGRASLQSAALPAPDHRAGRYRASGVGRFDQLYTTGCDPDSGQAWHDLLARLGLAEADATRLIDTPEVKARLKDNTTRAAADGIFGVPTITLGDRLFWGWTHCPCCGPICGATRPWIPRPCGRPPACASVQAARHSPALPRR
jgi:hypothetical protein